jgi:hypothetical protein
MSKFIYQSAFLIVFYSALAWNNTADANCVDRILPVTYSCRYVTHGGETGNFDFSVDGDFGVGFYSGGFSSHVNEDDLTCFCSPEGRVSQPVFGESNKFVCMVGDRDGRRISLNGKVKTSGAIFGVGMVSDVQSMVFSCSPGTQ